MNEETTGSPPVTVEALDQLVKDLFAKRQEIEEETLKLTQMNKDRAEMEGRIAGFLKELGRDNFKTPDGTVGFRRVWSTTLPKTDEEKKALADWMKERNIYDKYRTFNSQAINSLFLQERDAAQKTGEFFTTLPGCGEPKMFETITTRKS